jgi:putative ABC transport system substrate-binding protein
VLLAFRKGLNETGYVEGQNIAIEYRWAYDKYERVPEMAIELVRRQVNVIFTAGGSATALAAKSATAAIPVVFHHGSDPVKLGLVSSLNRPGGNITGLTIITVEMAQKRLEVLRELVPGADRLGFLVHQKNPNMDTYSREVTAAAGALGRQIEMLKLDSEGDFEPTFARLAQQRVGALAISADPIFINHREQLVAAAARHGIPAIYPYPQFVVSGGLMSYGPNQTESYRQAGIYVARILKGTKPADLPVQQFTKVELVINLKTAKALGLEVPMSLLMRVDSVIE